MKRLLFLLTITLAFPIAQASTWVKVTEHNDVTYYIDQESIVNKETGVTTVWYKSEPKKPSERVGKQLVHYSQGHILLQCEQQKFGLNKLFQYNKKGTVIDGGDLPQGFSDLKKVTPHTPADELLQYTCSLNHKS